MPTRNPNPFPRLASWVRICFAAFSVNVIAIAIHHLPTIDN
jgi:hypothetical protein